MSTYDTDLDNINNICSLVEEIVQLTEDIGLDLRLKQLDECFIDKCRNFIKDKALTIKSKATRMEERLKIYKKGIESMGFKRVRRKK